STTGGVDWASLCDNDWERRRVSNEDKRASDIVHDGDGEEQARLVICSRGVALNSRRDWHKDPDEPAVKIVKNGNNVS
ncbi:hypothetical protein PIIN_09934, partial [Serendipita indica DSM 11827]